MAGAFTALEEWSARLWTAIYLQAPNDVGHDDVSHLAGWLPEDERARWKQRQSSKSRFEFLLGRLLVRAVLGAALQTSPSAVRLVVSSSGKPLLEESSPGAPVGFSLSHAGGLFLVALSGRGEVGADIQPTGEYRDDLVQRFFHPDEQEALRGLAPERRASGFFHLWTVKEACSKAVGGDLFVSLRDIRCSLDRSGAWGPVRWESLEVDAGAKAAVAIRPHSSGAPPPSSAPHPPGRLERLAFGRLLERYQP